MTISLCMISKDEEKSITNSLLSINNFVDEIIIVDTGSKDNTIKIAKDFNAKVINSNWIKDFSFHRNESIAVAKEDWILILDCDEIITNTDIDHIKNILTCNKNSIKGYNVNIVNIINGTEVASFEALRLFKNFEGFLFEGPIHEQIITSIINKYSEEAISSLPITIYHYGYNDDVIKSKDKVNRNLEILHSIENKNEYTYAMIGDEYLKCKLFDKAIKYYEKSFELTFQFEINSSKLLLINYISSLININKYEKALNFIYKTLKFNPYFSDLYFLEFWILFYSKNFKSALLKLDDYINILNNNSKTIVVKKFYNLYDLNTLRSKTMDMV